MSSITSPQLNYLSPETYTSHTLHTLHLLLPQLNHLSPLLPWPTPAPPRRQARAGDHPVGIYTRCGQYGAAPSSLHLHPAAAALPRAASCRARQPLPRRKSTRIESKSAAKTPFHFSTVTDSTRAESSVQSRELQSPGRCSRALQPGRVTESCISIRDGDEELEEACST